ncbi:MAG: SLBB domain-containing protein, partial [Candidatus Korobacteraceae bacterium]
MIGHQSEKSVCVLLVLALTLALAGSAAAEKPAGASAPAAPAPIKMAAAPVPIAAGDLLEISVFDAPELTQQVRVGADGKAQLALLGSTQLGGLTGQEAADLIANELRGRHFLLRPQVNVLIKEFASKGVSVTGEVQHPGVYPVLGPRTLLDVLSLAGGLTNYADGNKIIIKHRSGTQEIVTAKLNNGDAELSVANDVQVFPGDLVLVPRAGVVYIMGSVNRPGGFIMQDSGKATLLQALAQAGGTSSGAAANKSVLLRKSATGGYATSKLRVGKISRGQDPDVELRPNDIVFVPSSRLKDVI